MAANLTIGLGDLVQDRITGLTGVAVAHHTFIYGTDRWSIQPQDLVNNAVQEPTTFDAPQLEIVKQAAPP